MSKPLLIDGSIFREAQQRYLSEECADSFSLGAQYARDFYEQRLGRLRGVEREIRVYCAGLKDMLAHHGSPHAAALQELIGEIERILESSSEEGTKHE